MESNRDVFLYMSDLSRSWKAETIALLINKILVIDSSGGDRIPTTTTLMAGHVRVQFVDHNHESSNGRNTTKQTTTAVARLEFASSEERQQLQESYNGLAIPHTHGYHHFQFHRSWPPSLAAGKDNGEDNSTTSNDSFLSVPSPPLHLQILAIPTKELQRRVLQGEKNGSTGNVAYKGITINGKVQNFLKEHHQKCKVWVHCHLAQQFLAQHHFSTEGRLYSLQPGVPAPREWTDRLWQFLRKIPAAPNNKKALSWPPSLKQRKGVQSSHYLTVRRQHPPYQDELWQLCRGVLEATVAFNNDSSLPSYNALAITKNFVGSPHLDTHDQTFQHVIAVGDFEGGRLCCELDNDGTQEVQINIHNRVGRMDGRKVHWVSSWQGKERYSVVYYSTRTEDWTDPRVPQSVHIQWMNDTIARQETTLKGYGF